MSAYMTLMTPMTDETCLLKALEDVGFDHTKVEVHAAPVNLLGYMGGRRMQTAHIVIPKRFVGGMSNDIGFLKTTTGYQALISGYDGSRYGSGWLGTLHQRYLVHENAKHARLAAEERRRVEAERKQLVEAQRQAVHTRAKKMGYRVKEQREGQTVRLVLVKRTY